MKRVWEILAPLITHEGMEIVDIDYRREGRGTTLRLFIDRAGGVTLNDLAPLSRRLGDVIDVHNAVPGPYTLEVSSPGINRRLRLPEHFRAYMGKRVRVRTIESVAGRRAFVGVLAAVEAEGIVVAVDGAAQSIRFDDIAQANYEHEFVTAAKPKVKPRMRSASR